jgi:hypothetical protein
MESKDRGSTLTLWEALTDTQQYPYLNRVYYAIDKGMISSDTNVEIKAKQIYENENSNT